MKLSIVAALFFALPLSAQTKLSDRAAAYSEKLMALSQDRSAGERSLPAVPADEPTGHHERHSEEYYANKEYQTETAKVFMQNYGQDCRELIVLLVGSKAMPASSLADMRDICINHKFDVQTTAMVKQLADDFAATSAALKAKGE